MNFVDDSENRRTENKENRTGYRVRATWIILGTYQQYTYLPRQVKKKKISHVRKRIYTIHTGYNVPFMGSSDFKGFKGG